MRIKQKKVRQIESTLKEIYREYKNKGILSIYLWGSISLKVGTEMNEGRPLALVSGFFFRSIVLCFINTNQMNDFSPPPWDQEQQPDRPVMNPKQIKGLWIPEKYLYAPDLSITEKHLVSYIFMLDQEHNCYASNKYLGELMGISPGRVANMLTTLKKKGYIRQVSWDGRIRKLMCV